MEKPKTELAFFDGPMRAVPATVALWAAICAVLATVVLWVAICAAVAWWVS